MRKGGEGEIKVIVKEINNNIDGDERSTKACAAVWINVWLARKVEVFAEVNVNVQMNKYP